MTIELTPKYDYLVGIDSDGCAFDTMELKHKECFIPNIINYWELQGVSKYAREASEFVNCLWKKPADWSVCPRAWASEAFAWPR